MVYSSITRITALVALLCLSTAVNAVPIPTATAEISERSWPADAQSGQLKATRSEDTNAKRMARGEKIKAPARRELKPRFDVAPSQAATSTDSETYTYVACASGGFLYYGSATTVSGSTDQELVDSCADQAASDGESTFAVEDSTDICYTGVENYEENETSCSSASYAIYSQST